MLEKPPSLLKPNSEPLLFKGRLEGKETQVMLVPLDCHCHLFQEAPMTTPILSRLKFVNLCCLAVFCPQKEQKHGGKEPELESENLCSLTSSSQSVLKGVTWCLPASISSSSKRSYCEDQRRGSVCKCEVLLPTLVIESSHLNMGCPLVGHEM